ncbi:MAG: helix-turn-helix domain-containing protein [Solirubrobacterales bacterium]
MGERGRQRRGDGTRSSGAAHGRSARNARARRDPAAEPTLEEVRSLLAARLRERRVELEGAIQTRAFALGDPHRVVDPAYLPGLRSAVTATVEYALTAVEVGERRAPGLPPALLAQARLAGRNGIALETVLRRCIAGNSLLDDLIAAEAERADVPSGSLRRLLASQATLFDRLLAAVSEEHGREMENRPSTAAARRRECVKQLLAGALVDHSELAYDLEAHHLAIVAKGDGGEELIRGLAARLERSLLAVRREEEPVWACWLGGRDRLAAERATRMLAGEVPPGAFVVIGEPGEGLAGWRFSHRQAKAALPVAERSGQAVVRYGEVALLASMLGDDLLASSLRQLYLNPLEDARDGGKVARETLRAYFASERNVSSTAAALGVDRRTVTNRIRAIEELLGRSLQTVATDLEIALRLDA